MSSVGDGGGAEQGDSTETSEVLQSKQQHLDSTIVEGNSCLRQTSVNQANKRQQPIKIPAKIGLENCSHDNDEAKLGVNYSGNEPRKGSVVSFQDTCELYEIDLEKGGGASKNEDSSLNQQRPSCTQSIRFIIMALALLSPFVVTYSRTIIYFAITDMIEPEMLEKPPAATGGTNASANAPVNESQTPPLNLTITGDAYFDLDNSCPVSDDVRARLCEENKDDKFRAINMHGEKFDWNTKIQGFLKSAYALGHAPLQIPGSRLSEMYGSHKIMSISAMMIGVCCLSAPYLAAAHYSLLFMDLFLLGVLGSFMTPALITLFSNWMTPGEKSVMLSCYLIASRLGYALSSVLCGLLIQAKFSWRYVFYSAGGISLAFSTMFFLFASSRPVDHPRISKLELNYLATKNVLVKESLEKESKRAKQNYNLELDAIDGKKSEKMIDCVKPNKSRTSGAPWLAILTCGPVWAHIITKFCVKLAGDTVQAELPSYLKRVMHFTAKENGAINAWNYVMFCFGCIVVGTLARTVVKKRPFGWSKTTIRKLFQGIASFGVSLILLGIAYSICDSITTQILLMLLFFTTTFGTGGEAQIPLDITQRYSGTLHAISSSLAITGVVPSVVGIFLKGHSADRDRWKSVWIYASGVAFLGGLTFTIVGDASIQSFDFIGTDLEKADGETIDTSEGKQKKINGTENKAFEKGTDAADTKLTVVNDQPI